MSLSLTHPLPNVLPHLLTWNPHPTPAMDTAHGADQLPAQLRLITKPVPKVALQPMPTCRPCSTQKY